MLTFLLEQMTLVGVEKIRAMLILIFYQNKRLTQDQTSATLSILLNTQRRL